MITAPPARVAPEPDLVPQDKWRHSLATVALGGALALSLFVLRGPHSFVSLRTWASPLIG